MVFKERLKPVVLFLMLELVNRNLSSVGGKEVCFVLTGEGLLCVVVC